MNIKPVTVAQLTENRFDIGNVSTGAAIRLVCVPFACERFEKEQNRLTAFRFSFRKPFPVRFLKHIICRPAGRGQDENACRGFAAAARNMHEKSALSARCFHPPLKRTLLCHLKRMCRIE